MRRKVILSWLMLSALCAFSAGEAEREIIILDDFEDSVGQWETVIHEGLGPFLKQTTNAFIGHYAMDVHIPARGEKGSVELTFNLSYGYPLTEQNCDGLAFYIKAKDEASAQQKFWVRVPDTDWKKRWVTPALVVGGTNWHKVALRMEDFRLDGVSLTKPDAGKLLEFEIIFFGSQPETGFIIDCFHGWRKDETDEEVRKEAR